MKKYMKIFVLTFLTLVLITACSSKQEDIIVDEPIVNVEDDDYKEGEVPDVDVDTDIEYDEEGNVILKDEAGDVEAKDDLDINGGLDSNLGIGGNSNLSNKSLEDLAIAVLEGQWGKGSEIKTKLEAAGYNYNEVNSEVTKIRQVLANALKKPTKPSTPGVSGGGSSSSGGAGSSGGSTPSKPSNPGGTSEPEVDKIAPTIILNGPQSITLELGEAYMDEGVIVNDNIDSGLDASSVYYLNGKEVPGVNVNTPGKYTIKYNAKDRSGNKAKEVTRVVIVKEEVVRVLSVEEFSVITVEQGEKYVLPQFANVNLSNSETRKAIVKWDSNHNSDKPGEFTIKGTLDLSLLEEVVGTDLQATINLIVKAKPIEDKKADASRIVTGTLKVDEVKLTKSEGEAVLNVGYVLNEDSYIDGKSLLDLNNQFGYDKLEAGVGYYSIGLISPVDDATHILISKISSEEGVQSYQEVHDVEVINGKLGKNLYTKVAHEVNSSMNFEANTGNWAPIGESSYEYEVRWYVGNPNGQGQLKAIDKLSVTRTNNYSITNKVSEDKFINEFRKIRKTSEWVSSLPVGSALSLEEVGFYKPFLAKNDGTNSLEVHYYTGNKELNSRKIDVVSKLDTPLKGDKTILDEQIKNKYWYNNLNTIADGVELPDANEIGAYKPFRISFEETSSGSKAKLFYYGYTGLLLEEEITLLENEIFGLEKESTFKAEVHNIAWYNSMANYMNFDEVPSIYEVGAYSGFILSEDEINTTLDYKGDFYHYDKEGQLVKEEYKLTDGRILVVGTREEVEGVDKTKEWFESLPVFSEVGGNNSAQDVGAYLWFKLPIEEESHGEDYQAYYYTEDGRLIVSSGDFEIELIIHGSQESIDWQSFTEDWWVNMDTYPVEDLDSWQTIGAYKWFKLKIEGDTSFIDPLNFKAYYFNDKKERIEVSGVLEDVEIKIHGTLEDIELINKNYSWFTSLKEYDTMSFASHWYYVGAYSPFRSETGSEPLGYYKVYYYTEDKTLESIEGSLSDEITINGSLEEIEKLEKTSSWFNNLKSNAAVSDYERSWLNQGAYQLFTTPDAISDLPSEDEYMAFYYNSEKEFMTITGRFDDAIDINGSQEQIDNTIKNEFWLEELTSYKTLEDVHWSTVGAYTWFRLESDNGLKPYTDYTAYYYNDKTELVKDEGQLVDEIQLGGRTEETVNSVEKDREWWRLILQVESFNTIESSWLRMGAYEWFKVAEDVESFDNPLMYRAYYYDEEKNLIEIEGFFEEEIRTEGTLEEIENTVHDFRWWNELDEYEDYVSAQVDVVGAYKWFKVKLITQHLEPGEYSAHYYDENGDMKDKSGILESKADGLSLPFNLFSFFSKTEELKPTPHKFRNFETDPLPEVRNQSPENKSIIHMPY